MGLREGARLRAGATWMAEAGGKLELTGVRRERDGEEGGREGVSAVEVEVLRRERDREREEGGTERERVRACVGGDLQRKVVTCPKSQFKSFFLKIPIQKNKCKT